MEPFVLQWADDDDDDDDVSIQTEITPPPAPLSAFHPNL